MNYRIKTDLKPMEQTDKKSKTRMYQLIFGGGLFVFGVSFLATSLTDNSAYRRDIASTSELSTGGEDESSSVFERISIDLKDNLSKVKLNLIDTNGKHLCDDLEKISIRFEAEGVAVSGAKPALILALKCGPFAKKQTAEFSVPNQQKAKRKPSSSEYPVEQEGLSLVFKQVRWVWPELWALKQVELEFANGEMSVIEPTDLSHIKKIQW